MSAARESREVKLLRIEIKDIMSLFVPEVESEDNELNTIVEREKEFKAGKYTDWSALKAKKGRRMVNVDLTKKNDILKSHEKNICAFLSESSLKKEWLRPEEDIAWRDL
jgi:hypothetical protein